MRLLGYPTNIDAYRTVKIEDIKDETHLVKTFSFKDKLCNRAKIGQYVMLWIQGVDEIPLSLSEINCAGLSRVTVEKVGDATAALHSKRIGDLISVRGPYGNSFRLVKGNVLVVGGGVGLAPLLPLLEGLAKTGSKITLIVGAKTRKELLPLEKVKFILEASRGDLIITTDDGSYGIKGLVTTPMKKLLSEKVLDMVYMCGPEPMMRSVFEAAECRGIEAQVCSERLIRCSAGLCGSCVIGKFRVCRDGPILFSEQLREIRDEFGVFKRDFNGKKLGF
jgi:dihydroorotate dehydrogenase electron transfer subunit